MVDARSRRRRLWLAIGLFLFPSTAQADGIFQISALPDLVWWASAKDSPRFQNPNRTLPVVSGDPVGFLGDLSGQNHNAVMGASLLPGGDGFRPVFKNLARGESGLLFDGADDFLDLQDPLFSDGTSFTLGLAIAADHADLRDTRLFGAVGASDGLGVGFANSGRVEAYAHAGSATTAVRDGQGHTLSQNFGPDTTQILIVRYQAGGTLDLWNNGQLVASTPAPAGPLVSQVDKLLGDQNNAAPGAPPAPLANVFSHVYFLEGMASRAALSDTQVLGLYNYWTNKLPGVQHQLVSPNLYWNAATNPDRTLPTTQDVGHIQGVASGDGSRFTFYTKMIEKYDNQWHAASHNDSILAGISNAVGPAEHAGDGDYYQGRLYVPAELGFGGEGQFIAVYDANQPSLPLVKFKDITPQHHEVSSLTIAPDQGPHGVMFVTSFFQNLGGDRLWMYDFASGDPNSLQFGSFLGSLPLPGELHDIQGVAWQAPFFYFSMSSGLISRVHFADGQLDTHAETVVDAFNTLQGLGFEGHTLLQAEQSGPTDDIVEPLVNVDALTTVPEPSTLALAAAVPGLWALREMLRRVRTR